MVIERLVPWVQEKYGENFEGLGIDGSYGRNEDLEYSDLELIVFLKELPEGRDLSIRKIVDGLLMEIIPDTKKGFIQKYMEISDVWYASGAGRLWPVVNESLIQEINSFRPMNKREKCMAMVTKRFTRYQEITAKLLNNIKQENREGVPLIFFDMIKELLIILSYLNMTPYKTLGDYFIQARRFDIKPRGLDGLLDITVSGGCRDLSELEYAVRNVFSEMEEMLQERHLILYLRSVEEMLGMA